MEQKDILQLMKIVARADKKVNSNFSYNGESFSYEVLNATLRDELNKYAKDYTMFRKNKYLLFELMEQTLTDILPERVLAQYGDFSEIKTIGQGDKPVFKRRTGKARAKQFITKVGLAGVYEVFKLGQESFEVTTSAIGGAAQIGMEEFLDGTADFSELTSIILDGLDEFIYREIARALMVSVNSLPAANQVAVSGFDEASMDRLIAVASAYGNPVIYCTYEFATKIVPATGWISEKMRDQRAEQGYLANYKGHPVIILKQSFEDETNATKVIDPGYAWIIPTGGEKPVKIVFEGQTLIDDVKNSDWSRDFQVYKKFGIGVMMTNNICCYIDSALQGEMATVPPVVPGA